MCVKSVNAIFYKFFSKDLLDIKRKARHFGVNFSEFVLNLMLSDNELFSDEAIKKIWFNSFGCNVTITNFIKYKLELIKSIQQENVIKPSKMLRLNFFNENLAIALQEKALKLKMKQIEYNTMKLFFAYNTTNLFSNAEINTLKQNALLENKSLKEYISGKILVPKRDLVKEFFTTKELAQILKISVSMLNEMASKNMREHYLYIPYEPPSQGEKRRLYPAKAIKDKLTQLGYSEEKVEQILLSFN